ncbi:MAG: LytTR family DNA-binding domain-containing protein [Eubacteriales bacterium]|nr:LytTR family DNA-binding domain-containing protein [Eubacteriales bacterium]
MKEKISVAICDDEKEILPYLARRIYEVFQKYRISVETREYTSPDLLWRDLQRKKEYTIYFLDVDMPKINGLEFAKMILQVQEKAVIIFVSAKEEYVFDSFLVHPFSFIRKSKFEEDLDRTICDLSGMYQETEEEVCKIYDELGHPHEISLKDTLYLEAKDKYVNIVTKEGGFFIRNTLSDMEKMLEEHYFIRIHKSFLVNLHAIYAIKYNKVILDGGQELPLSRSKVAEVKKRFCQES